MDFQSFCLNFMGASSQNSTCIIQLALQISKVGDDYPLLFRFGHDEATAPRFFLIPRLKEHGVDWIVNATVRKILPDGVVYEQNGTEYTLGGYDTIVLALGVRPNNPLEEAARALGKEVYVIGDASQPAPANKATEAALDAVLKLG